VPINGSPDIWGGVAPNPLHLPLIQVMFVVRLIMKLTII